MKHLTIPVLLAGSLTPLARWRRAPSFALIGWFAQAASPPGGCRRDDGARGESAGRPSCRCGCRAAGARGSAQGVLTGHDASGCPVNDTW